MTFVYSKYFNEIGPFPDIAYVCYLLQNVKTSFERDLLILLLRELVLNKENARKFISLRILEDLVDMSILSHLHTSRAPVPLQTLMIEGLTTPQTSTPVWYLNVGGKSSEPLSFQQLKEKYDEREIDENTKVWAQGMEGWKQLKDISQLKWTILHSVGGIFNQTDLAIKILDIVTRTCVFFPNM
ncbi:DnaJ subfamily C member 13 [Thelohanellus kitauei]|uniref:DnaJ subfamily C member 13 n=1 Tax=Thelohanellus kitauei TaxID=669202 RepID=A0A0C2J541_THEKT|nr:DnaJ subfamily C member 13 [Thelohanellus kitauei]